MNIVILTVQHMWLKKWISEDKVNGSCSMHVVYMNYINILLLRLYGRDMLRVVCMDWR